MAHGASDPAAWIVRWAELIPAGGDVLDLACGAGRHVRFLAARGHAVLAVDRDPGRAEPLRTVDRVEVLVADLETGSWPLRDRTFAGVVVTNYLWRPRLQDVVAAVAPGGALLYQTFAIGNEAHGRPANPDHLLRPGELLDAVRGHLEVVAYEHGRVTEPRAAVVQRIAAIRGSAADCALSDHEHDT